MDFKILGHTVSRRLSRRYGDSIMSFQFRAYNTTKVPVNGVWWGYGAISYNKLSRYLRKWYFASTEWQMSHNTVNIPNYRLLNWYMLLSEFNYQVTCHASPQPLTNPKIVFHQELSHNFPSGGSFNEKFWTVTGHPCKWWKQRVRQGVTCHMAWWIE